MDVTEVIYFCNELDLLEAHLEHHRPWGWRTIIAESNLTLAGTPKPLYFQENKSRFDRFDVEHLCLPNELVKPVTAKDPYCEFRDNDWRKRVYIQETLDAKNEWLFHADVDEIILEEPTVCDSSVNYISFLLDERMAQVNLRVRRRAQVYRIVKSNMPSNLISRPVKANVETFRGGWHFSSCPSTPEEILLKAQCRFWYFGVDSPDNVPGVDYFKQMFGKPYDYIVGRQIERCQVIPTIELPPWMQDNLEKFPVNYDQAVLVEELPAQLRRHIEVCSGKKVTQ